VKKRKFRNHVDFAENHPPAAFVEMPFSHPIAPRFESRSGSDFYFFPCSPWPLLPSPFRRVAFASPSLLLPPSFGRLHLRRMRTSRKLKERRR
jgi:hypothetical protein